MSENNEKNFVSKYKNPILKYLDEMNTMAFFCLIGVGIFAVIGVFIFLSNMDSNSDNSNGYKTNCYTRSDGKRCCTSCKKTSYGDVGCYTTCN